MTTAASQELVQGIVWLISMVGSYFTAWRFFVAAGKQEEKAPYYTVAIALAILGSATWTIMGADIIGRLVHPWFFVKASP